MATKFDPQWVYGPDKQSKLVYSQDELDALGSGWTDSPAGQEGHEESAPAATSDNGSSVNEGARGSMDMLPPDHTERDRLEAEAKLVGVKVTKSMTDEMIRQAILLKASQ